MLTCKRCGETKPQDHFYFQNKTNSFRRGACISCCAELAKERYSKNKVYVGHNKKNLMMPSMERLRGLFDYNQDGSLTRLISKGTLKAGSVTFGKKEKCGYRRIWVDSELYLFHRIVWQWHYGDDPKFIDHINQDRNDNRIDNLRRVDKNSNCRHQLLPKNNTSGFFGISLNKEKGIWNACISVDSKKLTLGGSKDIKKAVLIYNEACNKYHGEFGKKKIQHNLMELERRGL
jgi:HNH endonuclease